MSDIERKQWLAQERYFGRSWTHVFYLWKLRSVMLGKTTREVLLRMPQETRRVIDLGCGPGTNLFEVFDMCADIPGVQWYGLDLNIRESQLGARRSDFRVSERNMQAVYFFAGDLFHLPLADASMDMLLSSEVVEHLPDPRPAIAEMTRVLKPGGYAFITTPNPHNLPELLGYAADRLSNGAFKRLFWHGCDSISAPPLRAEVGFGHVSVQPYGVWRSWLEKSGLQVVRKVRGPAVFGGSFFDRHPWLSGFMIALDPLLDRMPGRFLLSNNLGLLCQKRT